MIKVPKKRLFLVTSLPPYVEKNYKTVENALKGAGFIVLSREIWKHKEKPVHQIQIFYMDNPLLVEGHEYKLHITLPGTSKVSTLSKVVDHRKIRLAFFNVWHEDAKPESLDGTTTDEWRCLHKVNLIKDATDKLNNKHSLTEVGK